MIVLVIGGNRFVGKDIVRVLSEWSECEMIYVFNRTGRGHYKSKKVRLLIGDRNVSKDLEQIPWGFIDYVVDMCLYKTAQFDKISKYVKRKNYVFVSSIASQLDPVLSGFEDYGRQKLLLEEEIRGTVWKNCIVRPTYVLSSPGVHSHIARDQYFLDCLYNGVPIQIDGDGEAELSFTFADDVIRTITTMIFHRWNDSLDPAHREVNLASSPITVIDLIKIFEKHSKKKAELFFNSPDSPFDNKRVVFPDKIEPTHFVELNSGVKRLVEEYEKALQK